MGKNTRMVRGLIADLDYSILMSSRYPTRESQVDDFITCKTEPILYDYLGQIIERANDQNEAIKQCACGERPKASAP